MQTIGAITAANHSPLPKTGRASTTRREPGDIERGLPYVLRALEDPSNRQPDGRVVVRWLECEKHGRYPHEVVDPSQEGFLHPQVVNVDCPACRKERAHVQRFSRMAIPRRYAGCTVRGFKAETEVQKRVKDFVIEFCKGIRARISNGDSLIFSGGFGNGKSHLACAIAKVAMEAGFSCQFVTLSRLIAEVHESWGAGHRESELEIIKRYAGLDLLIIDEIGAQYGTPAEVKILFDVLGDRYGEMRSTILISNAPLVVSKKQAAAGIKPLVSFIGDRVLDRFRENGSAAIGFTWGSYRGRVAEAREVE